MVGSDDMKISITTPILNIIRWAGSSIMRWVINEVRDTSLRSGDHFGSLYA